MVEQKACSAEGDGRGVRVYDARAVRAAVEQLARAAGLELTSEAPEDLLDAMAEALRVLSVAVYGERMAAVRLGRLFASALEGPSECDQPAEEDWDDFGGFAEHDGLGEGEGHSDARGESAVNALEPLEHERDVTPWLKGGERTTSARAAASAVDDRADAHRTEEDAWDDRPIEFCPTAVGWIAS
jgi:hypothetical protein